MTIGESDHISLTDELTASSLCLTDGLLQSFFVNESGLLTESIPIGESVSHFNSEMFRGSHTLCNSEVVGDSQDWTFSFAPNLSGILEVSSLLNDTQLQKDSEVLVRD
jgi:hypothetical protein